MGIRDILVFLDETEAAKQRLKLATSIALEHGACVNGVFFSTGLSRASATREPAAPWLGMMVNSALEGAVTVVAPASPALVMEEYFKDQASACGKKGTWLAFDASETDDLVNIARSTDLTIMGQIQPGTHKSPKWRPEDVIIRCGRPVLMVPYIGNYARVGRRVIVAWDGSREATRALNDALPLIHAANVVTLVNVHANNRERDQARIATERMLRHLERHGIDARTDEITQLGNSTADLLLSRSMDLSADLMIAGAPRHPQWHDVFFGSVCHEFFRHMTLPILMSH